MNDRQSSIQNLMDALRVRATEQMGHPDVVSAVGELMKDMRDTSPWWFQTRIDKPLLGGRYAGLNLYAVHIDGSRAYMDVSYNHSTRPSFKTVIVLANFCTRQHELHPSRCGVTKKNGWSIDPEQAKAEW